MSGPGQGPEPEPEPEPEVMVFVTTAVRTSAGCTPGAKMLPRDEAARLLADRRAIFGDKPPRGFS